MTALVIILGYLALLIGLGVVAGRSFRGTSADFFLASRSIGPVLLLMSLFGTTMTAFALVGSTGKAYVQGIGVYGMMASWSGLVHSAVFFLVGVKLWSLGKRHGYLTQVEYFRDRFDSEGLGTLLFPILVALVIPYLLIGLLGAGITVKVVTKGALPGLFAGGAIPPGLTSGVICAVVLGYVFFGGLRGAAWANALQTGVFLVTGVIAFVTIASALGGVEAASRAAKPELLIRGDLIGKAHFTSYLFVPLSVGMFPHLFQHWLTARSAGTFRLSVIAHPILIMVVWVPCILIGVWASGVLDFPPAKANAVLGAMVGKLTTPVMGGLLTAGILAAIMSSLDSQFLCLGTMFTNDVALRRQRRDGTEAIDDARSLWTGRIFVAAVILVTWLLSLVTQRGIFDLGVWCFSGFAGLFPLVFASLYWRRVTAAGAIASVLAAAGTWLGLFFGFLGHKGKGGGEYLVMDVMPVTFIVLASAAALVIVSLVTQPPKASTLARFFDDV